MNCPNFSSESVRNDFNTVVEALGGTSLSYSEFKDPEMRNNRAGIDFMAMEQAYNLWDEFNGNLDAILGSLHRPIQKVVNSQVQMTMESDSLNIIRILTDKIQKAMPGIDVQYVHSDNIPLEYRNQPAYRIGSTVYLVEDNVTMDSPMHEFGHIWIDVIELADMELYDQIMSSVNGLVETGNPIALSIKNSGQGLYGDTLNKEIFCKLLGLNSVKKITDYAAKNNIEISDSLIKRTTDFIRNIIKNVSDIISRVFFNGVTVSTDDSLNKVIDNLIDNILYEQNGSIPVPLSLKEELEIISNRAETNFNYQPVSNVSDIKHLIMGSEAYVYETLTNEEFASNLSMTNIIEDTVTGKFRFVYGPLNILLSGNTIEEARQSIISEVIPILKEFDSEFASRFAKYVVEVSKNKVDPEHVGEKLFPKSTINSGYFKKLYESLNLFDEVVGAYSFNELASSNNPVLKNIHSELVSGNYIVIVHRIDGNDVEISLVDIMPSKHNNVIDKYRNKKNVFKNFIKSDSKASQMGVTIKHSILASRQITNGFVAKSMSINAKNAGLNLQFRSIGTLGRSGSKNSYIQIVDLSEIQTNMNVLREVPEFMGLVSEKVKEVINSEEKIASLQNPTDKVIRFYEAMTFTTTGKKIETEDDIRILKTGTPADKKYIITKLMSKVPNDEYSSQEYRLLSQALAEYHLNKYNTTNRLDDMSSAASKFMNPHNFQSDLLQIFNQEYLISKGIVVDNCVNWQKSANPLVKDIINSRLDFVLRSRFQDYGSKIFEHLYKKVTAIDENGNEVEIIVPGEIHWAKNNGTKDIPSWEFFDNETKDLYYQGKLSDNDLLYAELVLDHVHDIYTKIHYENHKYDKVRRSDGTWNIYTMEDADHYVSNTVRRGFVPVMDKTANELMMSYSIVEGSKRLIENVSNPNVIFEDLIDRGKEMDDLRTVFSSQIDKDVRLNNYGIGMKNGQYHIQNADLYKRMSTNVDRIMAVFTLAQNRAITYSDRLVPLRNSIQSIYGLYTDLGHDQNNNAAALKYLSDNLINQRHQETKEGKGKFAKWVDSSSNLLTFAHIFAKVSLFFKSIAWNNIRDIIISTSNAVAQNGNYNTVDFVKAQAKVAGNINKWYTIARELQIIDRSEWDVVSNPLLVKSDRNVFQTWFGFLPNYFSDSHSRVVTMVAQMIQDGTVDAYYLDDETGDLKYDESLDKRIYDENGITPEGEVLKAAIKADLIEQGLMKESDTELIRGYDYQDAARLKYLSDKFVVGSYDQQSKTLGAQFTIMRLILKFRLFSTDRLQNAGLFMDERKSIAEGKRVVYKDEDGNLISKREMAELEGTWQSLKKVGHLLLNLRNKESAKRALNNMNASTRANLARTMLQLVSFYALRGVILGFGGGDDDDKESKARRQYLQRCWGWLYSDILITNIVSDFYSNPLPVVENVISFVTATEELVANGSMSKELINFVPGTAIIKDAQFFNEAFMGYETYQAVKKEDARIKRIEKKQRKNK